MITTRFVPEILAPALTIEAIDCPTCGVTFGLGSPFISRRREDRRDFYCPNGHNLCFKGPSRAEQLERQLKAANARETHLEDQLAATGRSAAAYKGQVTRLKKRAAAGVCPCCNRTFQNLGRHMSGQHPEFGATKPPAVQS